METIVLIEKKRHYFVSVSKQRYQDSNLEMPESESGALPFGDSARYVGERIRTPDLLVRSQTLYPAELRTHKFFICHGNLLDRANI